MNTTKKIARAAGAVAWWIMKHLAIVAWIIIKAIAKITWNLAKVIVPVLFNLTLKMTLFLVFMPIFAMFGLSLADLFDCVARS